MSWVGTRLYLPLELDQMIPGCYYTDDAGDWRGVTPNGLHVWLKSHIVVEHEDKTITVTPSILANGGRANQWHGYLKRGVWAEV